MNSLERRVIDISYKHKTSHIGSCLTAVNIIDKIFEEKQDAPFILSAGHAGVALYAVLEKYGLGDAEELYRKHGVHPNTDVHIACSSGSLGHGIGIAVGMALADRTRVVYCLLSDGECAEGSVWEALRIAAECHLDNLRVHVNANGYGANCEIDGNALTQRLRAFFPCTVHRTNLCEWPEYLRGLQGHYHVLQKDEYDALK
jgi:transketolase